MSTHEQNIFIDQEFASLIPPLSAEERQQLEENIIEHGGARDPLVVWRIAPAEMSDDARQASEDGKSLCQFSDDDIVKAAQETAAEHGRPYADCVVVGRTEHWALVEITGHIDSDDHKYGSWREYEWFCTHTGWQCFDDCDPMVLLDGHNRHEICTRLGLPFDVRQLCFDNRDEAADWIDKNQLGRRNLTADAFTLLLGRRYARAKKAQGGTGANQYLQSDQNDHSAKTADRLAAQHGVGPATVRRAEKFFQEVERTPELKAAVAEGRPVLQVKRELKEAAREARREENRKKIAAVPEPEKAAAVAKFATIVIDPPWDWGDEGDQDQLGRARPDYSTMTIEQLERLDVGSLADDDCHIYLWITNRSLPKGFRLLEAWGFRYITAITWVKPHFGMGNYFRGQTEHVLFGVKGSQPLKRKDVGTAFMADRGAGGHSSKPAAFLELVESCSPGPYIEMFSRSQRDGWVTWGENAK